MADEFKYLTEEEQRIIKRFPGLTAEELDYVNNLFDHYVFYKTVPGGRKLWTSCCHQNEQFYADTQRTRTEQHDIFTAAKHNDGVYCPFCGRRAQLKAQGLGKAGLSQWKNIVFLHCIEGELYAQAYCVDKDYRQWGMDQKPKYHSNGVYHFRLGRASMFYTMHGGMWHVEIDQYKLARRTNVRDPFYSPGMGGGNENYIIIHPEAIGQSQLRYCGYFEYWKGSYERHFGQDYSLMRFLAAYCVYPHAIEMMLKNGFRDAVSDLVFVGKKNAAAIKWEEKDPRRAFGLTKDELKAFLETGEKNVELVAAYKKLKKGNVKTTFEEIVQHVRTLSHDINYIKFVGVCLEFETVPRRFIKYLERYTGGCHAGGYRHISSIYRHWTDYIEAAKAIGYDLNEYTVCFPKDLQAAHDIATAEHNRRLQAEREAERAKRDAEYAAKHTEEIRKAEEIRKTRSKKYTYQASGFIIRPARDADEIIAEGRSLSHCVGGYADRHMKGKLTICFLRREEAPDKPFITIELDMDGRLVQAHGYRNEQDGAPDPEKAYAFILKPWLKWIAAGSKRDKDGIPIIKQKNKEVHVA